MEAEGEAELDSLWEACKEGDRAAIEALLIGDEEHPPLGVPVDVADGSGMTVLHWLTVEGHDEVAQWLVDDVGAQVDKPDSVYGQSALHFAASKDQGRVSQVLLKCGADAMKPDAAGWMPLHVAARAGAAEVAGVLLAALPSSAVDAIGPGAQTSLHRAAFWGHTEIVALLLEAGAVRSRTDARGRTAADIVCEGGDRRGELPSLIKLLRSPAPTG